MKIIPLVVGELDTNCYIVYDEGTCCALVVDPGDEADRILAAVEAHSLQVAAVVLTHGHFDHMMAAESLCRTWNVPLWVGAQERSTLADPQRNLSGAFYAGQSLSLSADRWLEEDDVLTVGEDTLTVMLTPGHTPGCLCLKGDELLLAGDTLFAGSIGRLDFPGGDAEAMRRSLARLAELPAELAVYPGHGPATTIGRERATNPYLQRL